MDIDNIKKAIIAEMELKKLSTRHEKLLEGLVDTCEKLDSMGLSGFLLIGRNEIHTMLPQEYHKYLAKNRKEELIDMRFRAILALELSRPMREVKIKLK